MPLAPPLGKEASPSDLKPGKAHTVKAEGVRWRNPHPWGESDYLRSLPQKDEGRHALHRPAFELDDHLPRRALDPVSPRTYPPAPGWSPDGHRISRRPWNTDGDPKRSGSTVLCGYATARRSRSPLPRAIPKAICGCSKPSSGGIRAAICTSSPTTSPATRAHLSGDGWRSICE